jgi:hypothetical protein
MLPSVKSTAPLCVTFVLDRNGPKTYVFEEYHVEIITRAQVHFIKASPEDGGATLIPITKEEAAILRTDLMQELAKLWIR